MQVFRDPVTATVDEGWTSSSSRTVHILLPRSLDRLTAELSLAVQVLPASLALCDCCLVEQTVAVATVDVWQCAIQTDRSPHSFPLANMTPASSLEESWFAVINYALN